MFRGGFRGCARGIRRCVERVKNIQREKQRAGGTPALRNGSARE